MSAHRSRGRSERRARREERVTSAHSELKVLLRERSGRPTSDLRRAVRLSTSGGTGLLGCCPWGREGDGGELGL